MESSDVPANDPAESLALIGHAQDRLEVPRRFAITYDVLFSIACGAFVAGQGLPSTIRWYVTIAAVLSFVALITWWRHRLGWWLSGYSPRRARWVAVGMVVLLLALMFWVWKVPEIWVAVTAGIVAAIAAFGMSRLWAEVWRRERMRAQGLA